MKFSERNLQTGLPDTDSNLNLTGLLSTVEINRDKYGIPHVRAKNVKDVFFGQGFVTAQDRLWHMDYDRMRAYGRWAEYAGEHGLMNDLFVRPLQIYSSVIRDYSELDENGKCNDVYIYILLHVPGFSGFSKVISQTICWLFRRDKSTQDHMQKGKVFLKR